MLRRIAVYDHFAKFIEKGEGAWMTLRHRLSFLASRLTGVR